MATTSMPNVSSELLEAFNTANISAASITNLLRVTELMFHLCSSMIYPDMEVSRDSIKEASQNADECAVRALVAIHRSDLEEARLAAQDALAAKYKALDAIKHMFKRFIMVTENNEQSRIQLFDENGFLARWNGSAIEYADMSLGINPEDT